MRLQDLSKRSLSLSKWPGPLTEKLDLSEMLGLLRERLGPIIEGFGPVRERLQPLRVRPEPIRERPAPLRVGISQKSVGYF